MTSQWVIHRLAPEKRRVYAARVLTASLVGWLATHTLFLLWDITSPFAHILNLILWSAIAIAAWDIFATTDAKVGTAARTSQV